jgi:hypothetical protein
VTDDAIAPAAKGAGGRRLPRLFDERAPAQIRAMRPATEAAGRWLWRHRRIVGRFGIQLEAIAAY